MQRGSFVNLPRWHFFDTENIETKARKETFRAFANGESSHLQNWPATWRSNYFLRAALKLEKIPRSPGRESSFPEEEAVLPSACPGPYPPSCPPQHPPPNCRFLMWNKTFSYNYLHEIGQTSYITTRKGWTLWDNVTLPPPLSVFIDRMAFTQTDVMMSSYSSCQPFWQELWFPHLPPPNT